MCVGGGVCVKSTKISPVFAEIPCGGRDVGVPISPLEILVLPISTTNFSGEILVVGGV